MVLVRSVISVEICLLNVNEKFFEDKSNSSSSMNDFNKSRE
jgi:hypothetical protein